MSVFSIHMQQVLESLKCLFQVISESLGHTTEKTTQIYLDSFENDVVDKYHEMIIQL